MAGPLGLSTRLARPSPLDPPTDAGVALLLAGCAIAGTLAPVRRAIRIPPIVALRSE